jgi:hypothetical protein
MYIPDRKSTGRKEDGRVEERKHGGAEGHCTGVKQLKSTAGSHY